MIKFYDRKTGEYKIEKVAGEKYLKWIHESSVGKSFLELFVKRKLFSVLYGKYCDSSFSSRKIANFIKEFDIDMNISQKSESDFKNFNDFFTRKLTNNARYIDVNDNKTLISPCDGKLLAYSNIDIDKIVQVKGFEYSLKELIGNDIIASEYQNGTCLIFRLCPTDYHRFHFFDSGVCGETNKITGSYYSVNPIALSNIKKVFCQNKREWSMFETDNFGDVLYVEVGATCVGAIEQTYNENQRVNRGDEKGYFKFGGSTVVLFFKKGKVNIDNIIIENSTKSIETAVVLGEEIGEKL